MPVIRGLTNIYIEHLWRRLKWGLLPSTSPLALYRGARLSLFSFSLIFLLLHYYHLIVYKHAKYYQPNAIKFGDIHIGTVGARSLHWCYCIIWMIWCVLHGWRLVPSTIGSLVLCLPWLSPNFIYGPLKTVTHSGPRDLRDWAHWSGSLAGVATKSGTTRRSILRLSSRNHTGQKVICAGGHRSYSRFVLQL